GEQLHRPRHGRGPRDRQHPRLRPGQGRRARRAQCGGHQREHRRGARRGPRGQADDRSHPRQHHRHPPAQGRRHRRLRRHRADAALLHPAGAPAPLLRQAPHGHLRAQRDHRGGAARGEGGRLPGRRPPGLHRRGADGRGDRRRAARARGHRQHGGRRGWRHHRGRGDLPRRHRHEPLGAHRRRRHRPGRHRVDEEGVLPDAGGAHRRGDEDDPRLRLPAAERAGGGDPRPRHGLGPAPHRRRVERR
ncbi:MAG: Rod shape-determining protein MreB, partial [uncultured Nocardioides sp.]